MWGEPHTLRGDIGNAHTSRPANRYRDQTWRVWVLSQPLSAGEEDHRGEPLLPVFRDKGEMAGSHGGPSETLAGLLPQEVWAAGECTCWERAWGSLLKSVKPQHGSHSLGSMFPFPTLTRRGSGILMTGEIPVSWYNVLAPQDTPAHEPTQCQRAPEGGAVPDQAQSRSHMQTQSLTAQGRSHDADIPETQSSFLGIGAPITQ